MSKTRHASEKKPANSAALDEDHQVVDEMWVCSERPISQRTLAPCRAHCVTVSQTKAGRSSDNVAVKVLNLDDISNLPTSPPKSRKSSGSVLLHLAIRRPPTYTKAPKSSLTGIASHFESQSSTCVVPEDEDAVETEAIFDQGSSCPLRPVEAEVWRRSSDAK
ncbi:hypothetical protein PRZ48_011459 [Zasmidium cellare]|uniref:Uncharacterized protein n=1 Tax=Zasmidium cellare TaxID=395010 RepID=A0ABR0E6L8_ZASCE|nr:hypothetical protein PRZ48_011459 [Zasmidium cellare]